MLLSNVGDVPLFEVFKEAENLLALTTIEDLAAAAGEESVTSNSTSPDIVEDNTS